MRYAVISDVHGNFTALSAVLKDCEKQEIGQYLFLGDYYGDFPMPNEVLAKIRAIGNAYVIKGNKEDRLVDHMNDGPGKVKSDQFAPLYWNTSHISNDNYRYIEGLPGTFSFADGDIPIYVAHSPGQIFGHGAADLISGKMFHDYYGREFSAHAGYLDYVKATLQKDEAFMGKLSDLPKGVFLYGHYHTQWHAEILGRQIINPGSCGLPLDHDTSAPYTILDTGGGIAVTERRVTYDTTIPVKALMESSLFDAAPLWCNLVIAEFESASVRIMTFFEFIEALARKRNDTTRPYSNELWNEAISLYCSI